MISARRRLENPRLLEGDLVDGRAQKLRMIDGNRGDDRRGRRGDDVGRVEAAAKADFEQQIIGRRAAEQPERRRRGDLEHGNRLAVIDALTDIERLAERGIVDELAREPNALVEAHQMRRRVDMRAHARRLENGAHEGDRRTLAVGAGDMDDGRHFQMRRPKFRKQAFDPAERQVDAAGMQRREARRDWIHRVQGPSLRLVFGQAAWAGDLASIPHRRASVSRISSRVTTMSTIPWPCRNSAR